MRVTRDSAGVRNEECWAVVVAAGTGSRMHGEPKQFRVLGGVSATEWSMRALVGSGDINGVVLVLPPGSPPSSEGFMHSEDLPVVVARGGATRADSVAAGVASVPAGVRRVMVHDAARPFVTAALVHRLTAALEGGAVAAVPVMPLTDTVKRISGTQVIKTLDRSELGVVQTPQAFDLGLLRAAHVARAGGSTAEVTDDAQLVEAIGAPVVVVAGERLNFKVTLDEDWQVASALVASGVVSLPGRVDGVGAVRSSDSPAPEGDVSRKVVPSPPGEGGVK